MSRITYVKSQNSGVLSAEDWVILERLLKYTISALVKDGGEPVTFIHFHYAPSITEVTLEFTD